MPGAGFATNHPTPLLMSHCRSPRSAFASWKLALLGSIAFAPFGIAHTVAPGPFKADWDSLAQNYQCPDWYRDAKFGIWAHWDAQCVPEQGDWYARFMYIQGTPDYKYHVEHYGHPSKYGYMELLNAWKAEHWDPEKLMDLYVRAGAKYFVALANHHDNFDCYDSTYQPWNSVRVGPHKDIVGTWEKIARAHGLHFGVSNHSSHTWHWFQPAYGHDVEGPLAGVPYDAATLTKADGKGKWWEGLDPADLYGGLRIPMLATLKNTKELDDWHWKIDGNWFEDTPPLDNGYTEKWYLRCQELVDKYHPDFLYFDDTGLPFGQTGLDIAAHFYNRSAASHGGKADVVITAKNLGMTHRMALVEDYERGGSDKLQPIPWQTDTCIGDWHYKKDIQYKSVATVLDMLLDAVSKNGNLLLSIPVRGDGTIDDREVEFLQNLAKWMDVNQEGIFGSRPWKIFGEGPSHSTGGMFNEGKIAYGAEDIRFTTKDGHLYAYFLGWPESGKLTVTSLHAGQTGENVRALALLGTKEKIEWHQTDHGLEVRLPTQKPCADVYCLRIEAD
jgi:alpha-L-fucosidase